MAISTQIERINASRDTIREKLITLGIGGVTNTSKLDALAEAIEGIANKGAVEVEIMEGTSYSIPAGYHNGGGVVKAMTDTAGDRERYQLQSKGIIIPTKSPQPIASDEGYYGLSSVVVGAIPDAYQNVSSVTATGETVLAGKIIVTSDGTIVTGTMVNNGKVSKTLDCTTISYTIPKGYHDGSGVVTIVKQTKSVTPTKSSQTITPDAGKVLSLVTVNPIPANYGDVSDASNDVILAPHLLTGSVAYGKNFELGGEGVRAVKVEGTMPNNGAVSEKLDTTTKSYTIPEGYHNGSGTVSIQLESTVATPTKENQTITPASGNVLSKVTVGKIPDNYADVSDASIGTSGLLAPKVLTGVTVYANSSPAGQEAVAVKVAGTMPDKGAVSATIDGISTTSYTVPRGYHNGSGTVSLTSDIEEALAAI